MPLDVTRALREPGEMIPFETDLEIEIKRDDFVLAGPLHLHGRFTAVGESIVVIGTVTGHGAAQCAKCIQAFDADVTATFEETFLRRGNLQEHMDEEENVDFFTYEGETVELASAAASALYLDMPMRFLCKEGCKGLCPVCGADRNAQSCACGDDNNNPFSALRALYPDE